MAFNHYSMKLQITHKGGEEEPGWLHHGVWPTVFGRFTAALLSFARKWRSPWFAYLVTGFRPLALSRDVQGLLPGIGNAALLALSRDVQAVGSGRRLGLLLPVSHKYVKQRGVSPGPFDMIPTDREVEALSRGDGGTICVYRQHFC